MEVIQKDITTVEPKAMVIHVCNNKGVMGAGVAKALYKKWPEVRYKFYSMPEVDLGNVGFVYAETDIVVANMIAQDGFGRDGKCYLDYDALVECVKKVAEFNDQFLEAQVYIPYYMGCGLAGGNWESVVGILDTYVPDGIICQIY